MDFMREAIKEAEQGIRQGDGGPFGAVVVRDGVIIGRGHNTVVSDKDCTNHGEMNAIRDACKNSGNFSLKGCVLYTTAEPCPMCLSAILWARIEKVYYGCTIADTKSIGFDDERFYGELERHFANVSNGAEVNTDLSDSIVTPNTIPLCSLECSDRDLCLGLFKEYAEIKERTLY